MPFLPRPVTPVFAATLLLSLGLLPAALTAAAPASDASPSARPEGQPKTLLLLPQKLLDAGANNMPSHTVLVPEGWTAEGGAWHIGNPHYFSVLPSREVKVAAPNGAVVELGPDISFRYFLPDSDADVQVPPPQEGAVDNGYLVMNMPVGDEGWRQWFTERGLPGAYPDATHIHVRNVSAVADLDPEIQWIVGPMQQLHEGLKPNPDANDIGAFVGGAFYAIHVTFERNGRTWEQLGVLGVHWKGLDDSLGRHLFWGVFGARSYTVPLGELPQHLPLMVAIADSVAPTPDWAKRQSRYAEAIRDQSGELRPVRPLKREKVRQPTPQIVDVFRRGETRLRRTDPPKPDRVADVYDPDSGSSAARKLVHSIYEVEDYVDADGDGTVSLPRGYDHVYRNGQGAYLLTRDVSDHPNTQNLGRGEWFPMNRPQGDTGRGGGN